MFDINFLRFPYPPTWHHTFFWNKTSLHSKWLIIFIIFSCCQWTCCSATQGCGSNVWLSSQDNPRHGSWGSEHQIVRTFHTIGSLKKCQSKASTFSCLSPTLIITLKQTSSHLASSWCKAQKMSTPFYIAVKKKRGMSIRNCVKSMEFRPTTFQKQHLAITDFSDKTLNCKLQSYLFLRRPCERSYCGRKGIKFSVLTFSKFI